MVICFECPQRTKRLIDELLAEGRYKDYSELLISAVDNLSVLQEQVRGTGSLVLETPLRSPREVQAAESNYEGSVSQMISRRKLLSLGSLPENPRAGVHVVPDGRNHGKIISLNEWIFGQYNKILPAKVSCRALANLLVNEPRGISLKEVAERIGDEARLLAEHLKQHDEMFSIERDDALSTAFPTVGSSGTSGSAVARYANHFVGHYEKGMLAGLLADLKLLAESGDDGRVALTEPGWRFALMPNPILDGDQDHPRQKFSPNEIDFLLLHIAEYVPRERFAYRAVLQAISEGAFTPNMLDAALQKRCLFAAEGQHYSPSFLTSQRSGAVSRMADLGLVSRIRKGTKVTYNVLKAGTQCLTTYADN